jgi:23S rRNA pseudouridine1911/1915/1917 synthase
MKLDVLYEDNHLIAVNKPAGLLVQEGDQRIVPGGLMKRISRTGRVTDEKCLMDEVKDYLKEKYQKPGNVFLGLIHRLDRNVSGIVLFAKTSKGASRLSEQFRDHTIKKIYHAWVEGVPQEAKATLKNYLIKDEAINKTSVHESERSGGDYAELSYELIKTEGNCSLLKIELKTGRSHQIRAQLSHISLPIVGDIKYGASKALPDQSIKLTATELRFKTATGDEEKVIQIPVVSL